MGDQGADGVVRLRPVKTRRWALANGFTHHGRLHGVPVWLTDPEGELMGPCVCAKNWLYEIGLGIGEAWFATAVYLGLRDPLYAIAVGPRIEKAVTEGTS